MLKKSFILIFGYTFLLNCATLNVYQDQSIYKFKSDSGYIGFSKGISATCNGENINLEYKLECSNNSSTCRLYNKIEDIKIKISEIATQLKVINTLIEHKDSNPLDANKLLESALVLAKEQSKLNIKLQKLTNSLKLSENIFNSITTSNRPLYLSSKCNGDLKVTIPYNYINFKPIYEANIVDNKIIVTQKLSLINRSGIDIEAKEAKFYFRPSKEYINPINFTPWIVKEYKPVAYRKAMRKKLPEDGFNFGVEILKAKSNAAKIPKEIGKYNDAREYSINNLTLNSSLIPKKVKILEYKASVECKLKSYPYFNSNVIEVCSFNPKYQVDINSWIIKRDSKLINKNAIGRYEDKKYNIYTSIDRDIKIVKKRVVSRERKSGIFGGTKKQKDGFTLNITNKSNKNKVLTIIERIPTSTTDKIEVKLLHIKPNVDYKLKKDGKLVINLSLEPKESKEIEVLFELSYNKDLEVSY